MQIYYIPSSFLLYFSGWYVCMYLFVCIYIYMHTYVRLSAYARTFGWLWMWKRRRRYMLPSYIASLTQLYPNRVQATETGSTWPHNLRWYFAMRIVLGHRKPRRGMRNLNDVRGRSSNWRWQGGLTSIFEKEGDMLRVYT